MGVDSRDYEFRRVFRDGGQSRSRYVCQVIVVCDWYRIRYFAFAGSTCRVTKEARCARHVSPPYDPLRLTVTLIASAIHTIKPRPVMAESGYGLASYTRDLHK